MSWTLRQRCSGLAASELGREGGAIIPSQKSEQFGFEYVCIPYMIYRLEDGLIKDLGVTASDE